jgi:replicative DNA helicase
MIELYHDHETKLEMAILGSLIMDKNTVDLLLSSLDVNDFFDDDSKLVFNSAVRIYTSAMPIDMLTIVNDMKKNKEPNLVPFIISCQNIVGSTANIESHIYYLKNISAKRKLMQIGSELMNDISNESNSVLDQIIKSIEKLEGIQNKVVPQKSKKFKDVVIEVIDENLSTQKSFLGIKTGFKKLDSVTGGLCAPDFTIIAAGPGEGKSTFALNQAKHISLSGKRVLFFSLEMKEKQMIWKLLSDELNISVLDVRMGHYPEDHAFKTDLVRANLAIYDKGGITIDDLCSIVKMEKKSNGCDVVFIDYLQLLRLGHYYRKIGSKNDEVTIISNKLKQLAMNEDIPIIALSQLNRDKSRKRYGLADLRDSGSLEQDADNVIFIFRPFEHQMENYSIGGKDVICNEKTAIINIEKNRLGQTGEFEMVFNGTCSRFEDLGRQSDENTYNTSINVKRNMEETPF